MRTIEQQSQRNKLREDYDPPSLLAWNFHRKGEIRTVFSLNRGDKISDFRETKAAKSYEVTHRRGSCRDIEIKRYANNALNFLPGP